MVKLTKQRGNAEGYCRKCHQPLGISGQCAICAVNELDATRLKPTKCPFCKSFAVDFEFFSDRTEQWEGAVLNVIAKDWWAMKCKDCGERWNEDVE